MHFCWSQYYVLLSDITKDFVRSYVRHARYLNVMLTVQWWLELLYILHGYSSESFMRIWVPLSQTMLARHRSSVQIPSAYQLWPLFTGVIFLSHSHTALIDDIQLHTAPDFRFSASHSSFIVDQCARQYIPSFSAPQMAPDNVLHTAYRRSQDFSCGAHFLFSSKVDDLFCHRPQYTD